MINQKAVVEVVTMWNQAQDADRGRPEKRQPEVEAPSVQVCLYNLLLMPLLALQHGNCLPCGVASEWVISLALVGSRTPLPPVMMSGFFLAGNVLLLSLVL